MLHFDRITDRASYSTLSFGDTDSLKLTHNKINIIKHGLDSFLGL